ncbi:sensor histidine kinase [Psychroserpens damuponensis]|uniref:sensor histidine kinase n=1 Tax=Psychroserpens damuponensis TaxID=943936 RepID=UPI00058F288D|nr:histidine kinase [Psychroserpens damuponensis]
MPKKTIYYWIIQIVVWSFFSIVSAFSYWYGGNLLKLEIWQIVLDFCVITLLSILITHVLKFFLTKFIKFDNLKLIDGFNIIWLLLLFTTFFFIAFLSYNHITYTYIYERADALQHESQSLQNHVIFFLNYGIYFMIWTVFYVAIKGLIQLNVSRETRLKLETSLKESQLNTLKGQINPHFMFNSLNNIRGLMLEDVDKARNMLTSLSETLRYSLTKNDVSSIALEDELEMIDNYIEISKIQFEDRLHFETHIDDESLTKQIPPMIIQMLVENAIKHGISKLKSGGNVVLTTKVVSEFLIIEVINTGVINKPENSTQLGLKNIEQRLDLLYLKRATFSLTEIENQVIATIKIPLS